ncbi:LOW QUALITY PROTEIN: hypothetical protein OSB04_017185 [Centaurea solstitialis]|uniref:Uncharacterized protein n=1 Tax=Centaurea solstitialis TaxID=347529 RepID=A0AA38T2F0_9ASTR|nr:LOW QUALITY PROTEIN: hypothetical protein OSB04_017185 [Centaurea solstitialis]
MESQLHHEEDEHKKSTMKKVKEKVHKLKETIKHGHGHQYHDEEPHDEKIMNESAPVRSGLMQPTDMGRAVLVEDLHATHSDILDTPVRSFAQWQEEEKHGAPPPLPTGIYGPVPAKVGHHGFNQNAHREQLRGSIGKSTAMEEYPKPATTVSPTDRKMEGHGPTTKTGTIHEAPSTMFNLMSYYVVAGDHVSEVGHHGLNQDMKKEWGGIGKSSGMEKDPTAPDPTIRQNVQTQVPAPTYTGTNRLTNGLSEGGYQGFDRDLNNREKLRGGIGKSSGMVQDPNGPNPTEVSPANHQTKVTDPTNTGGKEAGITDVLRSFNKMGVYDEPKSSGPHQNEPKVHTGSHDQPKSSEPDQTRTTGSHDRFVSDQNEPKVYTGSYDRFKSSESDQTKPIGSHDQFISDQNEPKVHAGYNDFYKSSESNQTEPKVHTGSHDQFVSDQNEPKVFTGSHDQFAPEPVEDVPFSTVARDPTSLSSSYTEKTTYTTSDKAGVEKDMMVSDLGEEDESETKSPTNYAYKVAEKVTGTLGPVYETVVGLGGVENAGVGETGNNQDNRKERRGSVKDYVVEALRPGDEDKVVSDVITNVFHRNDPPVEEVTSTYIYVRDEGGEERRLQESGN